ncbi:hypothetical+protein [Methylocapsa aurea]
MVRAMILMSRPIDIHAFKCPTVDGGEITKSYTLPPGGDKVCYRRDRTSGIGSHRSTSGHSSPFAGGNGELAP